MWNTAAIDAASWGRLLLLSIAYFVVAELDKIWGPVLLTTSAGLRGGRTLRRVGSQWRPWPLLSLRFQALSFGQCIGVSGQSGLRNSGVC